MAINATNKGGSDYEPIEAGTYAARCIQMIHIGTVQENIQGKSKTLNKVRISWELPTELKEFKEGDGEKPYIVSKDFTLSMNEKATLRKALEGWRGGAFTEEQAESFDITVLLGVPCMLSIIHKESKGKNYAEISSISKLMKGVTVPPQINPSRELNYDDKWDQEFFDSLPDFIKNKMKTSEEYKNMLASVVSETFPIDTGINQEPQDDLPF